MADEKKSRYTGKYEIYKEDKFYKYRLKASNGEVLFVSELYVSKDGAIKSIDAVKRNIESGTLRIIKDKRNMFKFKLVAKNHRTLAIGANYSNEKAAISASESFKRFAMTAEPVEIENVDSEVIDASMTLVEIPTQIDKKTNGKYVISVDENEEYTWALKASNGEVLVDTEGYSSKNGALNGIQCFKDNVLTSTFYCSKDKNGTYQFKMYSKSGRVIAIGESYDNKNRVQSVVKSVLSFYENAEIVVPEN